jgi:hypothetical protein
LPLCVYLFFYHLDDPYSPEEIADIYQSILKVPLKTKKVKKMDSKDESQGDGKEKSTSYASTNAKRKGMFLMK